MPRLRDNLPDASGARGTPPSSAGVRDQTGRLASYVDDPVRVRSAGWMPNGYLRTGYDTGRVW